MKWIKEKRDRTKKILKEQRRIKAPNKIIQVDFNKKCVVGEFMTLGDKNERSKTI